MYNLSRYLVQLTSTLKHHLCSSCCHIISLQCIHPLSPLRNAYLNVHHRTSLSMCVQYMEIALYTYINWHGKMGYSTTLLQTTRAFRHRHTYHQYRMDFGLKSGTSTTLTYLHIYDSHAHSHTFSNNIFNTLLNYGSRIQNRRHTHTLARKEEAEKNSTTNEDSSVTQWLASSNLQRNKINSS